MLRWVALVSGVLGLAGCLVDVDYGNGRYLCTLTDECPPGLMCDGQRCVEPPDPGANCGDGFCTESCASCPADCGACISGELVRWSLDDEGAGDATDSSGNGRVGTVTGGTRIDSPRGRALEFDGTPGHGVVLASATPLVVSDVAISAWVRVGPEVPRREVVSFGDVYGLRVEDDEGVNFFARVVGDWDAAISLDSIKNDQWRHLVGQNRGSLLEVYVDGIMVATQDIAPQDIYYDDLTGRDLVVGRHGDGGDFYMVGAIDDVRVFDRALSQSEISDLATR